MIEMAVERIYILNLLVHLFEGLGKNTQWQPRGQVRQLHWLNLAGPWTAQCSGEVGFEGEPRQPPTGTDLDAGQAPLAQPPQDGLFSHR